MIKPKVFIQTFCNNIDLLYGSVLVFDTLRVGFPTSEIFVIDNGSIPEARVKIEAAAKQAGCVFHTQDNAPFADFYVQILLKQLEHNSIVFLDPDVIFWRDVEDDPVSGLFSGRLIPAMASQGIAAMPRLHPSFLRIPDVAALRHSLAHRKSDPVRQIFASMGGKEYFWDTLAMLHQLTPGVSFTEHQLDSYEHLFFGSHLPLVVDTLPKNSHIELGHRLAKDKNFAGLKGLWRGQDLDFAKASLATSIDTLEQKLLTMPQADIRTEHVFYPGIYERRITIPANTALTGAVHKTPYKVRFESGSMSVSLDCGVRDLTAPYSFDAPAGVKRCAYTFTDCIWVDIYDNPDNCQDIAELESRVYEVPDCGLGENRVAAMVTTAQADFLAFAGEIGLTSSDIDAVASISTDLIPMPQGFAVELRASRIHGRGLFACKPFNVGDVICPGRINGLRTPAGRYINHSPHPNIMPVLEGDDILAVALHDIQENEELTVDYRVSMRVNFGPQAKEVMA